MESFLFPSCWLSVSDRFPLYFQTGLIVACYHGFVDTVVVLAECPHVDVNWQDSEGNTALITAAQAGKTWLLLPLRVQA